MEEKINSPQDNAAILENNDPVLCIFSQEGVKEHPPHLPEDQPRIQGGKPVRKDDTLRYKVLFSSHLRKKRQ